MVERTAERQATAPREQHSEHVQTRENRENLSNHVQELGRDAGPGSRVEAARHNEELKKQGVLPDLQLVDGARKTLGDSNASAAEKLKSVENLAHNGVKNIQVADKDGKMRDYSIETHKASGGREMVHLYGKDDNGKNQVALRGLDNGNGTFSQETGKDGKEVGFQGSKWGENGTEKSNVGSISDGRKTPPNGNNDSDKAGDGKSHVNPDNAWKPKDLTQPSHDPKFENLGAPVPNPRGLEATKDPKKPETPAPTEEPKKKELTAPPDAPKKNEKAEQPDGDKGNDTNSPYRLDRSKFSEELSNPKVRAAFAGRIESEVGTLGAEAKQAFAEEVMNRADSRHQTIMETLTNSKKAGIYYPTRNPGSSDKQSNLDAIDKAQAGSDTIHGATGNASKLVGFGYGGGHYEGKEFIPTGTTKTINKEHFGIEANDARKKDQDGNTWIERYAALKRPIATEVAVK